MRKGWHFPFYSVCTARVAVAAGLVAGVLAVGSVGAGSIGIDHAAGIELLEVAKSLQLPDFPVGDYPHRMLVVVLGGEASELNVTNVTYGGQALTLAVKDKEPLTNQQRVEIWWLANPPVGSGAVTVHSSAAGDSWCLAALSLYHVDPCGPVSTNSFASGNATVASIQLDVDGPHAMSVEAFANNSNQGAPTRNSGQALFYALDPSTIGSGYRFFGATGDGFTVSPTNQTWTNGGAGRLALAGAVFRYKPPRSGTVIVIQ